MLPPTADQRQGVFVEGGTINGPVVGVLNGTLKYYAVASNQHGAKISDGSFIAIATHDRVVLRPRAMREFYDRENSIAALRPELEPGKGAWIHGEPGSGISFLLRQATHLPEVEAFANGVIFLDGNFEPEDCDEILRHLFLAYHESNTPIAVQPQEARRFLSERKALFVLDRLPLSYDELAHLADTLSTGAVIISAEAAGPEYLLDMFLPGLPRSDALRVCSAATNLELTHPDILQHVDSICAALGDLPLPLALINRILRSGIISLEQIATTLSTLARFLPRERMVNQPVEQSAHSQAALVHATQLALSVTGTSEQTILACLARIGQLELSAISAMTHLGAAVLEPALQLLISLGLIRAGNQRYQIASQSLRRVFDQLLPENNERHNAAVYFANTANQHSRDIAWLTREQQNLLASMRTLLAEGQVTQAGTLARIIQPGFVLSGNWSSWNQLINLTDQAATTSADQSLNGWVLHERGTHAGLTGDMQSAKTNLREAIRVRKKLGDRVGADVSLHNLHYFGLTPPVWWKSPAASGVAIVATLLIAAAILWWNRPLLILSIPTSSIPTSSIPTQIVPSPTVGIVVPATSTATNTPSPTATNTPTPVATVITPIPRRTPVVQDDQATTNVSTQVAIPLLANDSSPDGQLNPASLKLLSGPAHGTPILDSTTGVLAYIPNPGFFGTDTLNYQVCDSEDSNLCNQASVTITVVRRELEVNPDSATTRGATPVNIPVLDNDRNPDGAFNPASVTGFIEPGNGNLALDPQTGVLTYTPNLGFLGETSFRYQVCDRDTPELCGQATVTITVAARPPVAQPDQASVLQGTTIVIEVLNNDSDPDGVLDPPIIQIVSRGNAVALIEPLSNAIRYTFPPPAINLSAQISPKQGNANVTDQFEYRVCSTTYAGLCSDPATVTITIQPNLLIANPDTASATVGIGIEIDVLANDSDPDGTLAPVNIDIIDQAQIGSARVNLQNNKVAYVGKLAGTDTFTYRICDAQATGRCSPSAIVTIVIKGRPINARNDSVEIRYSDIDSLPLSATQIPVLNNDSNPNGSFNYASLKVVSKPSHGKPTVDIKTGMITYTPIGKSASTDRFVYEICDRTDPTICDRATVTVTFQYVIGELPGVKQRVAFVRPRPFW